MRDEPLTALERMILNDVVRPALTSPKPDHLGSRDTMSETLRFDILLKNIKHFYHTSGGDSRHWHALLMENT